MLKKLLGSRSRSLMALVLLAPCIFISVPAIIACRAERQLKEASGWVSHTLEVERGVQRLLLLLGEVENGMQGFLLTRGDAHLASYHVASNGISSEAAVVRNLTADNAAQRQNFQQLDPLMAAMLAVVAQCISLQQRGERNAALRCLNADHGKSMEAIRAVLQQMEEEEQRLLVSRSEHLALQARMSTRILFFLVTLNMLFAGLAFILHRRLSKLRGLVTVCAWSPTVEYQGEWLSFETYLLRRFGLNTSHGISPVEAERVFGPSSPVLNDASFKNTAHL